jgi:hypothetical protein
MTVYVGLTDSPELRRLEHGDPPDWHQTSPFTSEKAARNWEAQYAGQPGFQSEPGGTGWRYGYWYTITAQTTQ